MPRKSNADHSDELDRMFNLQLSHVSTEDLSLLVKAAQVELAIRKDGLSRPTSRHTYSMLIYDNGIRVNAYPARKTSKEQA